MNDAQSGPAPTAAAATAVDDRNPWLGLASFTEETQSYFYGREDEVAELARRVQRKLLTVLFGQSGLGKTSILRAGLVPRLRTQGYCPVYVRIGYGRDAPEPAEQIKEAIARSARRAGEWTQAGIAAAGESLWEYMHHRDDVLQDEAGAPLIPLLIFDQFEEIFTLAQSDEFGRARAARFIENLADLVENRAPRALEAKLDADDATAERFDFARSDYRVLLALREDYLAPLESLKGVMPSITQNRLRLAPMTGSQALAAVLRPGKDLVSDEVAAAIVRFVAGGAEVANAEVEPSLLSLICRELNDTRIAQRRDAISLDLLAGSHATILSNFYERALADQPPAVRRLIEDELLTASGFRENIAEETLVSSLAAAGAAADTLALLVNRRLLRIEERLDVRRVELTHDVLCGVVKMSRDLRIERESRAATERLLTEQAERERATRRALLRARQVAAGCIVLAAGAVVAAILAYWSTQRAHRAERLAQETRGQAEQLLSYLTDDFARELESSGRLDVVADLAKREIDYFHALPAALKGRETLRNGALALLQYAAATRFLGQLDAASAAAAEALGLLEGLRGKGDNSDATLIALARGQMISAKILSTQQRPTALATAQRGADLLAPLAVQPGASLIARRGFVEVLTILGTLQSQNQNLGEVPVATLTHAMDAAAALGARDLSDLRMAALYAEAGAWRAQALVNLDRHEDARRVGNDVLAVSEQVLNLRPGYLMALHALEIIQSILAELALADLNPIEATRIGRGGEATALSLVRLDPGNTVSYNNLANVRRDLAEALWDSGQLRAAIDYYRLAVADSERGVGSGGGASYGLGVTGPLATMAARLADLGDPGADVAMATVDEVVAHLRATEPPDSIVPQLAQCNEDAFVAGISMVRGDFAAAARRAEATVAMFARIAPRSSQEEFFKYTCTYFPSEFAGEAEFFLGDYAAAEKTLRAALDAHSHLPVASDNDRRDLAEITTVLALALAAQRRTAEARTTLDPIVKFHRELAARNHGSLQLEFELARTLYAQSVVEPARRGTLLHEAVALVDALPAPMRALRSVRLWRDRMRTVSP